jgi:homoserine O-acetyltransferase
VYSSTTGGYEVYSHQVPFALDCGHALDHMQIAYETFGALNHKKDNAILLHCGMSVSSHARSTPANEAAGWWEGFIGHGLALDTSVFHVICTNNLGGCYGTTGPSSNNPDTGRPYGSAFPMLSVQDMVRAQFALLDSFGIERLHASVGASLGGMQVRPSPITMTRVTCHHASLITHRSPLTKTTNELARQAVCAATLFPDRVRKFVSISGCARSAPASIAFRHIQRQAVMNDPAWRGGDYYGTGELPAKGLALAREIGTITYRR